MKKQMGKRQSESERCTTPKLPAPWNFNDSLHIHTWSKGTTSLYTCDGNQEISKNGTSPQVT